MATFFCIFCQKTLVEALAHLQGSGLVHLSLTDRISAQQVQLGSSVWSGGVQHTVQHLPLRVHGERLHDLSGCRAAFERHQSVHSPAPGKNQKPLTWIRMPFQTTSIRARYEPGAYSNLLRQSFASKTFCNLFFEARTFFEDARMCGHHFHIALQRCK